jgi:hypothetical protein
MRTFVLSALLLATLGLTSCGGESTSAIPDKPIPLTKEQAEAIANEDAKVKDEEGGPAKVTQPKGKSKPGASR